MRRKHDFYCLHDDFNAKLIFHNQFPLNHLPIMTANYFSAKAEIIIIHCRIYYRIIQEDGFISRP